MKTLAKVLIAIAVLTVLVVGGFMATISAMHAKSRREITQLVSQIRPGTAFSSVAARLGPEWQTLTNVAEIESYGTTKDQRIVTNSALHMFVHGTIQPLWVCIYTDRGSQTVLYASWKDM